MSNTQQMFVDDTPAAPPVPVVDRSCLERWALCPAQAYHVDHGTVSTGSTPADVGNAVHAILANAAKARATEARRPDQLRDLIQSQAVNARPDLQPQVVDALRRAYPIVELLCRQDNGQERAIEDLLRYDGGDGDASGQLAADLTLPAPEGEAPRVVRLTAEMDLLMATASPEMVDLYDWKSGYQHWTATSVAESFQLGSFYPWLVMRNYPRVRRVNVRVWLSRDGAPTPVAEFDQRNFFEAETRLKSAAIRYLQYRDAKDPAKVPAWPAPEKCSLCPAVTRCVKAHEPAADLARDPENYLRQYVVHDAAAARMKAALTLRVRTLGHDLRFDGIGFGTERPVKSTPKAKPCDVYEVAEPGGTLD